MFGPSLKNHTQPEQHVRSAKDRATLVCRAANHTGNSHRSCPIRLLGNHDKEYCPIQSETLKSRQKETSTPTPACLCPNRSGQRIIPIPSSSEPEIQDTKSGAGGHAGQRTQTSSVCKLQVATRIFCKITAEHKNYQSALQVL